MITLLFKTLSYFVVVMLAVMVHFCKSRSNAFTVNHDIASFFFWWQPAVDCNNNAKNSPSFPASRGQCLVFILETG